MRTFFSNRVRAFKFAFSGVNYLFRTQPNALIHLLATILVCCVALYVQVSLIEWAILILTISLVWITEMINTAIEAVVDLSCPQRNPLAKTAKDVSAAAVLMSALASVLIGLIVLGPPLWEKIITVIGG